jgi:hypothetical protein
MKSMTRLFSTGAKEAKMIRARLCLAVALVTSSAGQIAGEDQSQDHRSGNVDPASKRGTARPTMAMDRSHHFELTPHGGLIAMQRENDDAERVAQIRPHFEEIAELFAKAAISDYHRASTPTRSSGHARDERKAREDQVYRPGAASWLGSCNPQCGFQGDRSDPRVPRLP